MEKIHYLYKENYFNETELNFIFDELNFLNNPYIFETPEQTGSSQSDNVLKKRNKGIWISDFYKNVSKSSLWRLSRKVLENNVLEYSELHFSNRAVLNTNYSDILLSYYENQDYYEPHTDASTVTVLFWFFKEPKSFEGGNLLFGDTDELIEVKNNSMIMFPSWATHSVTKIEMDEKFMNKKLGRYCLTMFLGIHPDY
jgi:Rps23 Pro-64 3,4-dihydroxylase Tpa1-like proline 4-hydroxylase